MIDRNYALALEPSKRSVAYGKISHAAKVREGFVKEVKDFSFYAAHRVITMPEVVNLREGTTRGQKIIGISKREKVITTMIAVGCFAAMAFVAFIVI